MPAEHNKLIKLGQIEIHFLLDGDDTDGRQCAFEFIVPPGARVPAAHYHENVDEFTYGLEGSLTFTVGGVPHQLGPGQSLFVPRGVTHQFINNGDTPTRTLAVLTPADIGPAYFHDVAALIAKGGPPDPLQLAEVMRRHGLVVTPNV